MFDLESLCSCSVKASKELFNCDMTQIDKALLFCADLLEDNAKFLIDENQKDIEFAKCNNRSDAFIDRLALSNKVISGIAQGLRDVVKLCSPVDRVVYSYENIEQQIKVEKRQVPFGVIGIIFEARPNVTADTFALCLKTKNAVILKGGSDALNSNKAIVKLLKEGLKRADINQDVLCLIEDNGHETAQKFMKMNKYVDLLIPRGGANLIKTALENSTIPIIQTGTGNCHIYVDNKADIKKAVEIIFNAKTQRYSVCNACESLVIHKDIAKQALPLIYQKLSQKQVEFYCDEFAFDILNGKENVLKATEEDFFTEYGCAKISVKTVDNIDDAISHINLCSTSHSESIITEDDKNAKKFMRDIDSACVYHNASTRFSDGFVFGLGAEIGISTQKLHARGPMGLDALLTTKYYVEDISNKGAIRK